MIGRKSSCRTVRVEVVFPDRGIAGSCLEKLARFPGVLLRILRGRVTSREAAYELELIGRGARVNEAVWNLWSAAGRSVGASM